MKAGKIHFVLDLKNLIEVAEIIRDLIDNPSTASRRRGRGFMGRLKDRIDKLKAGVEIYSDNPVIGDEIIIPIKLKDETEGVEIKEVINDGNQS